MKANRKYVSRVGDRAEAGVGTLIVFIAFVLVAAVAAAVLINTSGLLQERASTTGRQATTDVSSNLELTGVYGHVTSSAIDQLNVTFQLAAGALDMDLSKMIIRYNDGTRTQEYSYNTSDDPTADDGWVSNQVVAVGSFNLDWVRSVDGSMSSSTDPEVMKSGDLVRIFFRPPATISTRTDIELVFIPEAGTPVEVDFRTPATYGSDTFVTLR